MRRTRTQKTADISAGPLLNQEADGSVRFQRGVHKGKALSEIPKAALRRLLEASYPHSSDPHFLLNEFLSREYRRPMTAKTAIATMREDWEAMQRQMAEITSQPSLSQKLLMDMAGKLKEAANEAS